MRQLKHHEQKLLRKVSLYSWKGEDNIRVAKIMRRYHIQNREDYVAYTRVCGMVTKLAAKLKVSLMSFTKILMSPLYSGIENVHGQMTNMKSLSYDQLTTDDYLFFRL